MAKRFDYEEDKFIVTNFEAVGARCLEHDLGRSPAAITARARKLKATGAWDAILRVYAAEKDYRAAIGRPALWDDEDALPSPASAEGT